MGESNLTQLAHPVPTLRVSPAPCPPTAILTAELQDLAV